MARKPRYVPTGTLQHVISRFVDREWRIKTKNDRLAYLQIVSELSTTLDWKFAAYALMSSHEHWAFIMGTSSFSPFFHRLHTRFSIGWQKEHQGIGPIYAGRPKNYTKAPADMLSLVSYLHMNPVRAGVVSQPSESKWTSHRSYMRIDPVPSWIKTEKNLHQMGFSDNEHGRLLFNSAVHDIESDRLKDRTVSRNDKHNKTYRYVPPTTVSFQAIQREVEIWFRIPANSLCLRTRLRQFTNARRAFTEIATQLGWPQVRIAHYLNISPSVVSLLMRQTRMVSPKGREIAAKILEKLTTE